MPKPMKSKKPQKTGAGTKARRPSQLNTLELTQSVDAAASLTPLLEEEDDPIPEGVPPAGEAASKYSVAYNSSVGSVGGAGTAAEPAALAKPKAIKKAKKAGSAGGSSPRVRRASVLQANGPSPGAAEHSEAGADLAPAPAAASSAAAPATTEVGADAGVAIIMEAAEDEEEEDEDPIWRYALSAVTSSILHPEYSLPWLAPMVACVPLDAVWWAGKRG